MAMRAGERAGGGRRPLAAMLGGVVLLGLSTAAVAAQSAGGACGTCHRDLDRPSLAEPALAFDRDVHGSAGLPCSSCHGGDASAESALVAHQGMLARPPRGRTPELCGRCHSNPELIKRYNPDLRVDQVARYETSVHGERLMRLGDPNVATCVDCHSSHAIRPPSEETSTVHPARIPELCGGCHADPDHMAPYAIGTSQVEEYRRSVHWEALAEGGDLSAPVCNDCHGNHGAVPPGYASVGRVCAECHVQVGAYFAASPHDSAFVFAGLPGCATCHENHDIQEAGDEMLGLESEATCGGAGCHAPGDEGARVAGAMRSLIDSLQVEFARADSILLAAEHAGMPVSQAQFELSQATNALIGARAATHTADLDTLRAKIAEGQEIVAAGYGRGREAFEELDVRRLGLAVSSAVILLVIVGLVIKIRQLEASG